MLHCHWEERPTQEDWLTKQQTMCNKCDQWSEIAINSHNPSPHPASVTFSMKFGGMALFGGTTEQSTKIFFFHHFAKVFSHKSSRYMVGESLLSFHWTRFITCTVLHISQHTCKKLGKCDQALFWRDMGKKLTVHKPPLLYHPLPDPPTESWTPQFSTWCSLWKGR